MGLPITSERELLFLNYKIQTDVKSCGIWAIIISTLLMKYSCSSAKIILETLMKLSVGERLKLVENTRVKLCIMFLKIGRINPWERTNPIRKYGFVNISNISDPK